MSNVESLKLGSLIGRSSAQRLKLRKNFLNSIMKFFVGGYINQPYILLVRFNRGHLRGVFVRTTCFVAHTSQPKSGMAAANLV
jgi:hypothetical protein